MKKSRPAPTQRDLVALRLVPGLSRAKLHRLCEELGGPLGVLEAPEARLQSIARLDAAATRALRAARDQPALDEELALMEELGARLLWRGDPDYPALLALASLPPPLLYRRGAPSADDARSVAIVGARSATQYGRLVAKSLGRGLAMAGVVVVSGFAHGIDVEAMLAAARAGGRAVGVLGCGLAVNYPASNARYVGELLEAGALFSEYPMRASAYQGNFPERNGIIAAMTLGTCVVEAREKSGSLITAEYALEAGRSVFAVPGDISRETSRGANRLLQSGATLVMESGDILRELEPHLRRLLREAAEAPGAALAPSPAPGPAPSPANRLALPEDLTPQERLVAEQLSAEPLHHDELLRRPVLAGLRPDELAAALLNLELRGVIAQQPGRLYLLRAGRFA